MGRSYQLLAAGLIGADACMAPASRTRSLPALAGNRHAVAASADPLTNSLRLLIVRSPVTQPLNHAGATSGNTAAYLGFGAAAPSQPQAASRAELAQMMIEMFVHQDRPFVRSQRAEECMRMGGAACRPSRGETFDQPLKRLRSASKSLIAVDDEFFCRGGIPANRLFLAKGDPLD